ncbi:hypothetical protein OHS70_14160 [Streptomyces sp. NBC_00390]|uniref:hypothetical protein n=1 Tax=Streptomyces sp. NBC_00390 TaxID=2975736 RepID=UPI002E1CAC36
MLGYGKKQELPVIVLRDADGIADAVRAALENAPEDERPGLERAAAIIAEAATASDDDLRARWVRRHLTAAGVDGPADSVAAIKALRAAEPGLTLGWAVRLALAAKSAETATPGEPPQQARGA